MRVILFMSLITAANAAAQVQKFAPQVISNDKVFGYTVSKDQKTVFFVNSRGARDTMTLEQSSYVNNQWSKPLPVSFSNRPGVWKDIDPFITPDGKTMLFNSTRPTVENPDKKDFDVWASKWENGKWSEPFHLGKDINSPEADFFATASSNGNLYFTSTRKGSNGQTDIYRSAYKNGSYQPAVALPAPINSPADESNPYISPDEDFMIFLKTGNEGYGDSDLYIAFRKKNEWTPPLNLGPEINTEHAEFCPYFNTKTQTLYFGRILRGKPHIENIYFTPLSIKELRSKALK